MTSLPAISEPQGAKSEDGVKIRGVTLPRKVKSLSSQTTVQIHCLPTAGWHTTWGAGIPGSSAHPRCGSGTCAPNHPVPRHCRETRSPLLFPSSDDSSQQGRLLGEKMVFEIQDTAARSHFGLTHLVGDSFNCITKRMANSWASSSLGGQARTRHAVSFLGSSQ